MSRLKRHEIPENGTINMTPMLDVIFQLLIFFMLTSSLVRPTQIELRLPDSTSGTKAVDEKTLVVTYRLKESQPEIMLNAQPQADLEELGAAMRQLAAGAERPLVDIQIDKTVPYQDVIAVMDTVRDAGFPQFSLLTLAKTRPGIK